MIVLRLLCFMVALHCLHSFNVLFAHFDLIIDLEVIHSLLHYSIISFDIIHIACFSLMITFEDIHVHSLLKLNDCLGFEGGTFLT